MPKPTVYVKGDWNAVCDDCGRRFRASQLKKRWDGLMVCPQDFELRHPQDFVRAKPDIQAVPWTRPESEVYSFELACTTRTSISGYASAGCMITGNTVNPGTVPTGTFTI